MDLMEKVEKLREKTGVSYSEAKAALEQTGEDLLEALCWLETHGKVLPVAASSTTEGRKPPEPEPEPEQRRENGFARGCRSLWEGLISLVRKCNQTELIMTNRSGQREFALPLTLFIILLLAAFWAVIVLVVVALFFGNRFSVEGQLGHDQVNDALGKAADYAESIKDDFSGE